MKDKDSARISHMLFAAKEALSFVKGKTEEEFATDRQLILAIIKEIEIIGEAANQITEEFKNQYSDIPWQDIIATRHRLIHGYFDVNLKIVWKTLTEDLPELVNFLSKIS